MTVEELQAYGLEEMTDGEIHDFLMNEGVGVLGLPTDGAPYLVPIGFGYDGDTRLYFSYFLGGESRKATLTEQSSLASFLVYSATSVFSWESVQCTGPIARLPKSEWPEHDAALENAWHLEIFDRADTAGELAIYELRVQEKHGIKHTGLPPGFAEHARDG